MVVIDIVLLVMGREKAMARRLKRGCGVVQEGDQLLWVGQCQEDSSALLASSAGKALHLATTDKELRPLGRPARGLRVPTSPSLPFISLSDHAFCRSACRSWVSTCQSPLREHQPQAGHLSQTHRSSKSAP